MATITGLTRGGETYIPNFVVDINQGKCIGCGRCFKVCPRNVFDLIDREDADGLEATDYDDDFDEYDENDDGFSDDTAMVMSIKNAMDCIGCGACARICPKKCFTHEPQPAVA